MNLSNKRINAVAKYFEEELKDELVPIRPDYIKYVITHKMEESETIGGEIYIPEFDDYIGYNLKFMGDEAQVILIPNQYPVTTEGMVALNLFNSCNNYKAHYFGTYLSIESHPIRLVAGREGKDLMDVLNSMIKDMQVLSLLVSYMDKVYCPKCGELMVFGLDDPIVGETFVCTKCKNEIDIETATGCDEHINFYNHVYYQQPKKGKRKSS